MKNYGYPMMMSPMDNSPMMMSPADPNKMMMPPMDNCQMLENQIMNLEKRVTRLEGMMEGKTLNHAESNNFYMV